MRVSSIAASSVGLRPGTERRGAALAERPSSWTVTMRSGRGNVRIGCKCSGNTGLPVPRPGSDCAARSAGFPILSGNGRVDCGSQRPCTASRHSNAAAASRSTALSGRLGHAETSSWTTAMRGLNCSSTCTQASTSGREWGWKAESVGQLSETGWRVLRLSLIMCWLMPALACMRVAMKCSSRPREKMSALHLGCALLRYTSGAIQNNVPPNGLALRDSTRARPKSKSLG
mmetsp:Transcript_36902/g.111405  ORF Transcript_36902/g.111405 Transcript_36902/m.111405 type:complete len:230 (-) Transcript_36902:297-986(-)